jgi:hypothetical protein
LGLYDDEASRIDAEADPALQQGSPHLAGADEHNISGIWR